MPFRLWALGAHFWPRLVLRLVRLCVAVLVLLGCAAWTALCTTMWCALGQLCGFTCSSSSSGLSLQQSAVILWLGHSDFITFAHQLWRVLGRLPVVVLSAAHGRYPEVKAPTQRCLWSFEHRRCRLHPLKPNTCESIFAVDQPTLLEYKFLPGCLQFLFGLAQ